eukprot:278774-Hanusia_phi.AAC.3
MTEDRMHSRRPRGGMGLLEQVDTAGGGRKGRGEGEIGETGSEWSSGMGGRKESEEGVGAAEGRG